MDNRAIHEWVGTAGKVTAIIGAFATFLALTWTKFGKHAFVWFRNLAKMPCTVSDIYKGLADLSQTVSDGQFLTDGKFKILFSSINQPVWKSDGDGNCVWCNPAMLTLLGRTFDDIKGQNWVNIIAEDDRDRIIRSWFNAVRHKRTFDEGYHWKHHDGSLIPIHATGTIIFAKDSIRILGIIGIVTVVNKERIVNE